MAFWVWATGCFLKSAFEHGAYTIGDKQHCSFFRNFHDRHVAYWHSKFGNVDKSLFKKLVIPGAIGGILGAYILTQVPGEGLLKAFVSIYLLGMSIRIIFKSLSKSLPLSPIKKIAPLGLAGGFFDAIGGGGWGPIVTATLLGRGHKTHIVVGSVNAAEFVVTICQSATFFTMIGLVNLNITISLVLGGSLSAPVGPFLSKICLKKCRTRHWWI